MTSAYNEELLDRNKTLAWAAWTGEALARQKKLPSLKQMLGEKERAQTDEELMAAVTTWVTQHNARWEMAEKLKAQEGSGE